MGAPLVKTKTLGIYKRGSRYVFSYRVNGKQRWESCRTLEEARRAKAARQTDIGRGFREETRGEYRGLLERYALRYFPARLS